MRRAMQPVAAAEIDLVCPRVYCPNAIPRPTWSTPPTPRGIYCTTHKHKISSLGRRVELVGRGAEQFLLQALELFLGHATLLDLGLLLLAVLRHVMSAAPWIWTWDGVQWAVPAVSSCSLQQRRGWRARTRQSRAPRGRP
jgi:hypothetical protein